MARTCALFTRRRLPVGRYRLELRARNGGGPAFLLCNTYRYRGHHVGDVDRSYYRSKEEEKKWREERDPLQLLADWLVEEEIAERSEFEEIEARVSDEVSASVEFALDAPYPDESEVDQHVYV